PGYSGVDPGDPSQNVYGVVYLFPYNHTPVAEEFAFWTPPVASSSFEGELFAIDPYEAGEITYEFYDPSVSLWVSGDSIASNPMTTTYGEIIFDTISRMFTYTPDTGHYGQDSFIYRVIDADGAYSNEAVVTLKSAVPGDASLDGRVNAADAQILAANWGQSNAKWEMGDFNGDGIVNAIDAAILSTNWGYGEGGGEQTPAAPAFAGQYLYHKLDGSSLPIVEVDPVPMTVTGYAYGIVGVVIDVVNLPGNVTIDASDFVFKIGNTTDVENWSTAPAPSAVIVHAGEGVNGSDRIEIHWADNSIVDQWLQVTVLASGDVALGQDHAFYFGSLRGDTDSDGDCDVFDFDNFSTGWFAGATTAGFREGDFNLDGVVNGVDMSIFAYGWFGDPLVDLNAASVVGQYLYHLTDANGNPIVEQNMTVTGYSGGIVGVAIDIDDLPSHVNPANISANDFLFEVYDAAQSAWVAAPAPTSVSVYLDQGVDGADRIAISWNSGSITAEWLRVRVLDTLLDSEGPGVADYHDFIFGSLPGDVNGNGSVSATDASILGAQWGQTGVGISGGDLNLDGIVDALDAALLSAYWGWQLGTPGE
ncbi:MAG: hypothetical protein GX621_18790, partial [Pirellulaceae bacterium]|nr:hypothetical protein [Pirellulaceae bacterium]